MTDASRTAAALRRPPPQALHERPAAGAAPRSCSSSSSALLQILRPGIVNERWIANTIKFAIPLAMLAGCQTLTMLTGGIDLSVGTVATMAAFIMATQVAQHDPAVAILIGLVPAVLIGLANGIGVGVFRVHPLIMTLGTSLIGTGCLQVYQRTVIATGTKDPATRSPGSAPA